MHNLLFAFRYLLKPRGGNLARLVSLMLALAVSIVVFSYANYVLTYDRFYPDVERLYQLWDFDDEGNISSSMIAPLGPALQEEIPAVEAATRLRGNFETDLCRDNHTYEAWVMAVDSMFFRVLDFGLIKGDMSTFTGHDKLMLSESLARTIFGDSDPIGQSLLYENATPRTVVGIFRDPPRNTHLGDFNTLIPFDALAGSFYMGWDGGDSFPTYLKLRAGHTPSDVEALLPAFFERHGLTKSIEQFGSHYLLLPVTRSAQTGTTLVQTTRILLALALLILFVGVMNYVLLSISSLASRAKTFAMLRCNGARRGDVLAIFLSETLILTAAALLVAAFVIWALQQQITGLTDTPLGELFAPARIWVPMSVVLVTFLAAGLLPAQLFAATPLTLVFRGMSADHRWWKRLLLVVELLCVTFAFVLLTGFSLQLHRLRYGDFGFDASRVVSMSPVGTRAQWRNMEEAFTAMPEVEAAGATSHLPVWGYSGQPCYDEMTREMLFGCRFSIIDENYLATMGMHLVAGDNFTLQSSPRDVLVNETYCRMRGWTPEEALGRRICSYSDQAPEDLYIIRGVVHDFRTQVASGLVEPVVLHNLNEWMPREDRAYGHTNLCLRLREITPEALEAVSEKLHSFETSDNYRIRVLDMLIDEKLRTERQVHDLALLIGCIVLLITLVGLVGYLDDEMRRRSREIAIRKVNGASAADIFALLTRDAAVLTLPSVAAGTLAGYLVLARVLELFVERIALRWWIFAGVAAAVTALVLVILLIRTWRAITENPRIKTE